MDEALRPLGLTTPQYDVLSALEAEPGMSNARLARALFVTPQTMHGTLSNLARRSLVERVADKGNSKRIANTLTERGAAILAEAHTMVEHVEKRLAEGCSADETRQLTKALMECACRLS